MKLHRISLGKAREKVLPILRKADSVKTSAAIARYTHLSIPEKIIILEELWDEIAKTSIEDTPVPQSHKDELNRRHARYLKNPGAILSVKELQKRIGYDK